MVVDVPYYNTTGATCGMRDLKDVMTNKQICKNIRIRIRTLYIYYSAYHSMARHRK